MQPVIQTKSARDAGLVHSKSQHVSDQVLDKVSGLCGFTPVTEGHQKLLDNLANAMPGYCFQVALTRGGWHRVGGLVSAQGERISKNLRDWIVQECAGDVIELAAEYADAGYVVTHDHGKTLYMIARTGDAPGDFIQLEIEELQEACDHLLFDGESLPDDIDDLIDPYDATSVEPSKVGEARYHFRSMTDIATYLRDMVRVGSKGSAMNRFIDDWSRSSAGECGSFSDHWVMGLREFVDAYGEPVMRAQPISTHTGVVPRLEKTEIPRGSKLANMIHGFDRDIGYPMAWYFYMLTHSNVPYQLVEAIHSDQMGAYDYLPPKDLKVLIDWYNKPYSV
jgi:hypothetical protein